MPDRVRRRCEQVQAPAEVIVGIRPEHFEDAALVGRRAGRARSTAPIDLVESMGSDVYAYFTVQGEEAHSADLDDLAKDAGQDMHGEGTQITARLDAAATSRRGEKAELWVDTEKMQIFDADTGANLTSAEPGGTRPTDRTSALPVVRRRSLAACAAFSATIFITSRFQSCSRISR